jgi:hypothetical protein
MIELRALLFIEPSGAIHRTSLLVDPALRPCVEAELAHWSIPSAERDSRFRFGFSCAARKAGSTRAKAVRAVRTPPAERGAVPHYRCTANPPDAKLDCQKD